MTDVIMGRPIGCDGGIGRNRTSAAGDVGPVQAAGRPKFTDLDAQAAKSSLPCFSRSTYYDPLKGKRRSATAAPLNHGLPLAHRHDRAPGPRDQRHRKTFCVSVPGGGTSS
jgi:hypothetical protein